MAGTSLETRLRHYGEQNDERIASIGRETRRELTPEEDGSGFGSVVVDFERRWS
jgi:hypothetical protein